ncbi:helix-turn-helix domain-containing protein [Lascolabacillus massiliensis]|jgi:AraC family transcriptional activator of pobA|uniref:helix-turn-helix domain-containing protein n=1 Tax=Lascolabacillus massiliensis TaxID=1627894 RepID=UPI0006B37D66|nr:helix-turn-helix domain-containing protein [Lascolabacillus massiliensis]
MINDQYILEERIARRLLPDNGYLMLDSSTTDFHVHLKRTPFILDAGVVVFVCLGGEAEIVVDMKRIHIHRGSFVLVLPYSVIQLVDVSDDLKVTLIATGMGFLEKLAMSHPVENYVEKIREMPNLQLSEDQLENAKEIYSLVEKRYREASGPLAQEVRNTLMTYLSLEIVTLYAMNQPAGKPRISRQEQIFRNFTISLAKHVREHRTVEFYANEACLTPKHFSMVIKKRSGKLPMEWITERTVALIKFLLTNTDQSIQEISNGLNFPNQSFFTRYFKRHTGLTPTAYRQESIRGDGNVLMP